MSLPPPPPPRPDLVPGDVPAERWRGVEPGRMTAPAVVGAGMRLWAEHWVPWGLVTLLFAGVLSVVLAIVEPQPAMPRVPPWVEGGGTRPDPWLGLVTLAAGVVLGPWLYTILTRASLRATFAEPGPPVIGGTIRGVPSVLWILVLLVVGLIASAIPFAVVIAATATIDLDPGGFRASPTGGQEALAVLTALAFILIVFLWLVPRLILVVHVYVAEDRRGTRAIGEAWRRTRGAWWMALGVVTLDLLIGIGVSLVPTSVASSVFPLATVGDAVPRAVLLALTNALITPIGFAITSALYTELSARAGVLSQAALARSLARFDPP